VEPAFLMATAAFFSLTGERDAPRKNTEGACRMDGSESSVNMVRPSAASLNSLAELLRQAQSLYTECRSILNYLDDGKGIVILPPLEGSPGGTSEVSANKDEDSIPRSVLEPKTLDPRNVM
jgi:hypothetical protein